MSSLEFKIYGSPGEDQKRRRKQDNQVPRNRGALWLAAGFVLAYLLGAGTQSRAGLAIISPPSGTATFESQPVVSGTLTNSDAKFVTLRVDGTTLTAPVANGIFTTPVSLTVGKHEIRAVAGEIESEPISIIRKDRPVVRINSPAPVSTVQDPEVEVLGAVDHLEGSSITLEVNGDARTLAAAGGRFSTRVALNPGTNTIRAVADGADPVAVIVVRAEVAAPAVVITSPATGFTADGDSTDILGTVLNSSAGEVTLHRKGFADQAPVLSGQFKYRMSLDIGQNQIWATLGDAASEVIVVNRRQPQIVIATDPRLSNPTRAPTSPVYLIGTVEYADPKTVIVSLNSVSRPVPVRDRHFEFLLPLRPGASYRIQASLENVLSNEIEINVLSPRATNPNVPGSPVTPEECAQIQCDCDNVRATPTIEGRSTGLAQSPSREALRARCLEIQRQLRAICEKTHQLPKPCPPQTSGPKAWPSALEKKGPAPNNPNKGVKQP